jgi:hypothetical protein
MIDAVHRYDGHVVQSTGDGIFALFGAPVAHEDHPQRALYAALQMQEEMCRFAERLRAEKGINLQVRVGANVGEVVVRSIRSDCRKTHTSLGHSIEAAKQKLLALKRYTAAWSLARSAAMLMLSPYLAGLVKSGRPVRSTIFKNTRGLSFLYADEPLYMSGSTLCAQSEASLSV